VRTLKSYRVSEASLQHPQAGLVPFDDVDLRHRIGILAPPFPHLVESPQVLVVLEPVFRGRDFKLLTEPIVEPRPEVAREPLAVAGLPAALVDVVLLMFVGRSPWGCTAA